MRHRERIEMKVELFTENGAVLTRSKGSVNLPQGSVNLVVLCYFSKNIANF